MPDIANSAVSKLANTVNKEKDNTPKTVAKIKAWRGCTFPEGIGRFLVLVMV